MFSNPVTLPKTFFLALLFRLAPYVLPTLPRKALRAETAKKAIRQAPEAHGLASAYVLSWMPSMKPFPAARVISGLVPER